MVHQNNNSYTPLVSVIITTYDRPENIMRAINSVIYQTYPNIEIIVVDDNGLGSENQKVTELLLSSLIETNKITYIPHDVNRNGSAARNTGWYNSSGLYINFVDDDDELLPDKIKTQVEFLESNRDFDAVCCNTIEVTKGTELSVPFSFNNQFFMSDMLQDKLYFNTTTVLFTSQSLKDLNGWDESFLRHQDYEIFMRFEREHNMGFIKESLIRKHTTPSIVNRNPLKSIEYLNYFLNKFKSDIDGWPQKNNVYKKRYLCLSQTLLSTGYKKEGLKYFVKSLCYGLPNIKNLVYLTYFVVRYKKRYF